MSTAKNLLSRLTNADDTVSLSSQSKQRLAHHFLIQISTSFVTKLADAVVNPKITLTLLLSSIGAHPAAIALLVPLRESGSMLPQVLLADRIPANVNLVRVHQTGTASQAAAVVIMVLTVMLLTGEVAGWVVLAGVTLFSIARCLCSLVSKAVLAQHIPKSLRGQTGGWAASAAGLATCAVAAILIWIPDGSRSLETLQILLCAAAVCGLVATWIYGLQAAVPQHPAASAKSWRERLSLLGSSQVLQQFIVVRLLLLSTALIGPFFILLGGSVSLESLGGLLLANGIANLFASPLWGRFADTSSRRLIAVAAGIVTATGIATIILHLMAENIFQSVWVTPVLYFIVEVAHQGVRLGRKTYIVNIATDQNRLDYVALSNTITGFVILLVGILGGILSVWWSPLVLIGLYTAMAFAGSILALRLMSSD